MKVLRTEMEREAMRHRLMRFLKEYWLLITGVIMYAIGFTLIGIVVLARIIAVAH
jgi:hypothetical protein